MIFLNFLKWGVILMDVLEHTFNDTEFLKEILKKTPQDSFLFITVPSFQFLFSSHDVYLKHYRRYTGLNYLGQRFIVFKLYKGFLDGEKGKIFIAFILLVFMTSVYQAVAPLFCCGVFVCFLLLQNKQIMNRRFIVISA